ncbi:MAG: hypothetical protein JXJ04_22330 [Spirochaetales bacterium]|nr:hypothetical protein [Spirochaetales bacterium]
MVVNSHIQSHHFSFWNAGNDRNNNTLHEEAFVPYSLEKGDPSVLKKDLSRNKDTPEPEINIAEKRLEDQLRRIDAEVRAHEHSHIAAAGGIATSGAKYVFVTGPDGKLYAVGGEVSIDTSPVPGDPEKTIQKARKIRRAALSPANPSAQDMRVAAAATQMERQAQAELMKEKLEGTGEEDYLRKDYLRVSLEDIYSEKSTGMYEESYQLVDLFA